MALLASVATLGVAMLAGVPAYVPSAWAAAGKAIEAPATQTQAPEAGFADLVTKVRPAVISVRIQFNGAVNTAGATNDQTTPFGQNFRDFFGQFGFGNTPNMPPQGQQRVRSCGLGILHLGGRLCGDQQSRGQQRQIRPGNHR